MSSASTPNETPKPATASELEDFSAAVEHLDSFHKKGRITLQEQLQGFGLIQSIKLDKAKVAFYTGLTSLISAAASVLTLAAKEKGFDVRPDNNSTDEP